MTHGKLCLLFCLLVFSNSIQALQLPFETGSVGRIQGDSLADLDAGLDAAPVTVHGADYYTSEYLGAGNEQMQTYNVLQGAYGANKVTTASKPFGWGFWKLKEKKTPTDRALILQTKGVVKDSKVRAFDGFNAPMGEEVSPSQVQQAIPLAQVDLAGAIEGKNLVISDVDFAGTYLPSMGKQDSFSSQLAGKAALIATNGVANPAMVKAIVCSLALQDKGFGAIEGKRDDYYYFNSLGDRLRNAKNNLAEFGSGEAAAGSGDFSLYAAPFTQVNGTKLTGEQLNYVCGNLAKYNTFPSLETVSIQSDGPVVYTKNVSLDFSGYAKISDNGFEIIDVNGAMQKFSEGSLVLPQAISEVAFPANTIIKDTNLVSMSNPITLEVKNLPSWVAGEFSHRSCGVDSAKPSVEFSNIITEGKSIVVAKLMPVEVVDCNAGIFRLYRNIEFAIDYTPFSPVLLKRIDAKNEAFPAQTMDVNILLENITPLKVEGMLVLLDGNEIISQTEVSLAGGANEMQGIPVKIGENEGFYDYSVVFDQNGEAKTSGNFKVRADVLTVELDFAGSKKFYDDFESLPFDKKWSAQQISFFGNEDKSLVFAQSDGALKVLSHAALSTGNVSLSTNVEGNALAKEGIAVFDEEINSPMVWNYDRTLAPNGAGNEPWISINFSAQASNRLFYFPENELNIPFNVVKNVNVYNYSRAKLWSDDTYWYLYVNGVEVRRENSLTSFIKSGLVDRFTCNYCLMPFEINIPKSYLKNNYNVIEIREGNEQNKIVVFSSRIYLEPKECSGENLSMLKDNGTCAGNIRFSIHELPLTVVFAQESGVQLQNSGVVPLDLSGNYKIDKDGNTTLKWKKGTSENWNIVDVSGWDKERLGFAFYTKSYYSYNSSSRNLVLQGKASAKITDGTNSAEFAGGELNYNAPAPTYQNYDVLSGFIVSEIMRPYPESARGDTFLKALFENKSNETISLQGKYVVTDENRIVGSGDFSQNVHVGGSQKEIEIAGLKDPEGKYSANLIVAYNNRSRLAGKFFSGNSAPEIIVPPYIRAYAHDNVVLDYTVVDPDNDQIDVNIGEPFSSSNVWQPIDSDVGVKEVVISANDGFEISKKTVTIEVLPARIECHVDSDCGSTITIEPRVCSNGALFAQEKKPLCVNPGEYTSYCSTFDFNRVYGYCAQTDELSDGESSKTLKFSSAGKKSYSIVLPRKAKVTSAILKVFGKSAQTTCFNPVQSFDAQNSTVQKYNFANGTKFIGLPLGDSVLVDSREMTSDQVGAFPPIVFTPSVRGVATNMQINAACGDIGNAGRYAEFLVPCDNSVSGWSSNFIGQCNRNFGWIGAGIVRPESDSRISDFCEWGTNQKSVSVAHNINTVYFYQKGHFAGIYDARPAFRAYVRQFVGDKELYLGEVAGELKHASLNATEDLRGQSINYFISSDGSSWVPIGNNSSIDFNVLEAGAKYNWKAVLKTADPAVTPRLNSVNLCTETFATPQNPKAIVGGTEFALPSAEGFSRSIDIADALNDYISKSQWSDGNIIVPIEFSAGSDGIMYLNDLGYKYDVLFRNAPVIEPIEEQYAFSGEHFLLQAIASDYEGDKITFSDDSDLFDINSQSGLIEFTATKKQVGLHHITVTASDGELSSAADFNLLIVWSNLPPKILSTIAISDVLEGEEVYIGVNALDPDGDELTYSIDSNNFDVNGNNFSWLTTPGSAGAYIFTVTVSDGNLFAAIDVNVLVKKYNPPVTNHSPSIRAVIVTSPALEGDEVSIAIFAEDKDGNVLIYSIDDNRFVPDGNGFRWQTDYNSAGDYNFTVTVSDGNLSDSDLVSVKVKNKDLLINLLAPVDGSIIYGEGTLIQASTNLAADCNYIFTPSCDGEVCPQVIYAQGRMEQTGATEHSQRLNFDGIGNSHQAISLSCTSRFGDKNSVGVRFYTSNAKAPVIDYFMPPDEWVTVEKGDIIEFTVWFRDLDSNNLSVEWCTKEQMPQDYNGLTTETCITDSVPATSPAKFSFNTRYYNIGKDEFTASVSDGLQKVKQISGITVREKPPRDCSTGIADGLAAYYCFEGGFQDSSVNRNNGVAHNGVSLEELSSGNNVARFNGIDGYIEAPDSNSLRVGQSTISFWIRRDLNSVYAIGRGVNYDSTGSIIRKGLNATNEYYIDFRYGDTFKSWNSGTSDDGSTWSCEPEFGKLAHDYNWHHVVQVRAGLKMPWYIDGKKVGGQECPIVDYYTGSTIPVRNNPLWIGTNYPPQLYKMFKGSLDEIMLYNRPLLAEEVMQLYNEQLQKFEAPTTTGRPPTRAEAQPDVLQKKVPAELEKIKPPASEKNVAENIAQ